MGEWENWDKLCNRDKRDLVQQGRGTRQANEASHIQTSPLKAATGVLCPTAACAPAPTMTDTPFLSFACWVFAGRDGMWRKLCAK